MRKLRNEELDRLSVEDFKTAEKSPVAVILDNVRSMNNIGSIFRTADAFRLDKVILCGITATPPHKDIHRTALGATESVEWQYFERTEEAVQHLRNEGYVIVAVEQTENNHRLGEWQADPEKKYALVFGHEVRGIQQNVVNMADFSLEIPQFGTKHSLNISVCAGIVIWEFFKMAGHKKSG